MYNQTFTGGNEVTHTEEGLPDYIIEARREKARRDSKATVEKIQIGLVVGIIFILGLAFGG